MKTIGIIAEYNPFHNGHRYQIEEAKKITGADYAVVIMSGDYVQRGTPALANKYIRTQLALNGGADIVFELPIIYSTASAEYFARGGVSILNSLSCIDYLCFGSESGDIDALIYIADIISDEPLFYKECLKSKLKEGVSFPAAREYALLSHINKTVIEKINSDKSFNNIKFNNNNFSEHIKSIISMPNNILSIEYLKALKELNSSIKPITIKRKGSDYHDSAISKHCLSSASAVRSFIENEYKSQQITSVDDFNKALATSIQPDNLKLIYDNYKKYLPISTDDFSIIIRYALRNRDSEQILETADFSKEVLNKIKKNPDIPFCFTELSMYLKSKKYTFTRIQRMLLHLVLSITKEDLLMPPNQDAGYVRLLGFNKKASPLLRYMQDNTDIPIITKPADARKNISNQAYHSFEKDITASRLYNDICTDKFNINIIDEYKRSILIHSQ